MNKFKHLTDAHYNLVIKCQDKFDSYMDRNCKDRFDSYIKAQDEIKKYLFIRKIYC